MIFPPFISHIHFLFVDSDIVLHYQMYMTEFFIISKILLLTVADRGVQFVSGMSDTVANIGERAELSCKLSSDASEGRWYKNGKVVSLYITTVTYTVASNS